MWLMAESCGGEVVMLVSREVSIRVRLWELLVLLFVLSGEAGAGISAKVEGLLASRMPAMLNLSAPMSFCRARTVERCSAG